MEKQGNLAGNVGSDISLGLIFRLMLMQSKLIILIVTLITGLGLLNYLGTEKTYKYTSMLQVYSNKANSYGQNLAFDLYLGDSSTTDFRNIQDLYKSRSNILRVINDELLFIDVPELTHKEKKQLFSGSFIKNIDENFLSSKATVSFKKAEFIYEDNTTGTSKSYAYNDLHDINGAFISIKDPGLRFDEITLNFKDLERSFKEIKARFQIISLIPSRSIYQNVGLFNVTFTSKDESEAKEVLNYTNSLFITESIKTESEQARKAITFIDQRIDDVKSELDREKNALKKFREDNKSVDVDKEIAAIISALGDIESQINQLDIEISTAENNYTDTNPIFLNLLKQRETLNSQKIVVEERIKNLPLAQQEYIDLFRNVEITEEAYANLLNRRLEFSIKEASTLGNIRIVDDAYFETIVSPRLLQVGFVFMVSIFLSILVALVRGIFFLPISNPAELQDNDINIPIIGVIPKKDDDDDADEKLKNSLESLIVNLETFQNEEKRKKIISITSSTPGNGKTFASKEIANKLTSAGNKVLLLDFDFKRGDLHKYLNREKIKFEEFININDEKLKNYKVQENFYFIPKISRLNDSFQFLYTEKFNELLEFFVSKFDYVVMDTAPLLSVSDTSMLLTISDIKLAVCRHGLSNVNQIKQLCAVAAQIGCNFDGIIYNAYEKPNSYYGYYGLYGNYNYQYYAQKYLYDAYDYDGEK